MNNYSANDLSAWGHRVLSACGVSEEHSRVTMRILVRTSLRGIDTHGISRLPSYVRRLRSGATSTSEPAVRQVAGAVIVDGNGALGQVVAIRAAELLIEQTNASAAAVAHIKRSGHLSALGIYALHAAERGRIAFVAQCTEPLMALPGSPRASIGNNPLAFAAPVAGGAPLVFDISNSVVARGHVVQAARDGMPIPSTWAASASGNPTTSASEALEGFLLPMASHKGLGLAMMVQALTGALTVADAASEEFRSSEEASAFMLMLNPAFFGGAERYSTGLAQWLDAYRSASVEGTRYPGERQDRCEALRTGEGIPLPDSLIAELAAVGDEVGQSFRLAPRQEHHGVANWKRD